MQIDDPLNMFNWVTNKNLKKIYFLIDHFEKNNSKYEFLLNPVCRRYDNPNRTDKYDICVNIFPLVNFMF